MFFLVILGWLCYAFAAIDFAGQFFDYDLTGVSWSPIAAGLLGAGLCSLGEGGEDEGGGEDK